MLRGLELFIDTYDPSSPANVFVEQLAKDPLKSKDKIQIFYKEKNLAMNINLTRRWIEYGGCDKELKEISSDDYLKRNKNRYVCLLLLDEAMHDQIGIFNIPCFSPIVETFSLLMPVAAAFSSKKYIKEVYRLNKFDIQETLVGLDISIRLRDFDLLKAITEAASENGLSMPIISKKLYEYIKNGASHADYVNPLSTAISKGYVEGVMYLLAEGYDIKGFSKKLYSYLRSAIQMACQEESSEISKNRKEIIYHLMDYHDEIDLEDKYHLKDYRNKIDLEEKLLGKEIRLADREELTNVLSVLKNPAIIKNTIHSFFQNSKTITSDRQNINIICEYISPKNN